MTLQTRLSKLEATTSPAEHRIWQRVIGGSKEECEAKRRALVGAGPAWTLTILFFVFWCRQR